MADRLKSLERIQAVQAQMVRLTEWRLSAAARACRELNDDQVRLRAYMSGEGRAGDSTLGAPLTKAALKSILVVDRKLVKAERDREIEQEKLGALKRRERVAASMTEQARVVARRIDEDRDLAATMDAWFAGAEAGPT